ncbi:hypothetical protein [Tahibacter sp.]|uniref:hypothetical protein n=1 Tax=Tahibacter sp. TaxID=2056211 RepID=UPI0028C4A09F|nr:hypothetical protein [Tahibacter sp.]
MPSTSLLLALLALVSAGNALAATFVVDTGIDTALAACLPDIADDCSLRGALERANQTSVEDRIEFAIPTSDPSYQAPTGHWRIAVGATALPSIENPVVIDGYTQPGALENTQTPDQGGLDALLAIELVPGTASGPQQNGLEISLNFPAQAASTFRGLAISRFARQIQLGGSAGHRIEGCFLGTDIRGSVAAVSGSAGRGYGIVTFGDGPYVIGGTTPAARNLISGLFGGIVLQRPIDGLVVQGNLIGTDFSGTLAIPHTSFAAIQSSAFVTNARIGGDVPAARNVISGNPLGAINLDGGANGAFDGTRIEGNYIGTDASGTRPLGNSGGGPLQAAVRIFGSGNCALTIGGDTPAAANRIAFNAGAGIGVVHCRRVDAGGNRFIGNRGLPIDLAGNGGSVLDGPTPNDAGDADEGSNRLQNVPVIENVAYSNGGSTITLTYRVDTAAANAAWPLRISVGRGTGGGSLQIDSYTQAQAQSSATASFPASTLQGAPFMLLATDADGNSSEFASDTIFADMLGG